MFSEEQGFSLALPKTINQARLRKEKPGSMPDFFFVL